MISFSKNYSIRAYFETLTWCLKISFARSGSRKHVAWKPHTFSSQLPDNFFRHWPIVSNVIQATAYCFWDFNFKNEVRNVSGMTDFCAVGKPYEPGNFLDSSKAHHMRCRSLFGQWTISITLKSNHCLARTIGFACRNLSTDKAIRSAIVWEKNRGTPALCFSSFSIPFN